jgi:rod shape-determining protein MreD
MAVVPVKGAHRVEPRTAVPLVKQRFPPAVEGGEGDARHEGDRRTACRRVQVEPVALDTRTSRERRKKKRRRSGPAMTEFGEPVFFGGRGKKRRVRVRPWVMLVPPLAALLFQVYVPLYLPLSRYLELTLLVTVYLAVSRRGPVAGAVTGALIGLVQDSLSNQPLGVFGMVKTVIGYAGASLGVRLDTGHAAVRFGLGCFFFAAHQLLYEAARRWLLDTPAGLPLLPTLAAMVANGAVGVLLFYLLDKLRDKEA